MNATVMLDDAAAIRHSIPSATRDRGHCLCASGEAGFTKAGLADQSIHSRYPVLISDGQGVFHPIWKPEALVRALRVDAHDGVFARRYLLGVALPRRAQPGKVDSIGKASELPPLQIGCAKR